MNMTRIVICLNPTMHHIFWHMLIKRHYRFRLAYYYLSISIFCKLLWTGVFPFSFIPHRCISSYFLSELNRSNCFWQKNVSSEYLACWVTCTWNLFQFRNSKRILISISNCYSTMYRNSSFQADGFSNNKLKYILVSVYFYHTRQDSTTIIDANKVSL